MDRLWVLLADSEPYRSHGGASQYLLLLVGVAVVVVAIVGFYLWNMSRRPRDGRGEDASPEDLLAELYRMHELTRAEQSLITVLVRQAQLAQPASLFVDPDLLDRAAESADVEAPGYRALRQKLYGSLV